jgi:hypothetical protein
LFEQDEVLASIQGLKPSEDQSTRVDFSTSDVGTLQNELLMKLLKQNERLMQEIQELRQPVSQFE